MGAITCIKCKQYSRASVDGVCLTCHMKTTASAGARLTLTEFLQQIEIKSRTDNTRKLKKEFVTGLHSHNATYHFDDSPEEIVSVKTGVKIFDAEQCRLLHLIIDDRLYCDYLFQVAIKLTE